MRSQYRQFTARLSRVNPRYFWLLLSALFALYMVAIPAIDVALEQSRQPERFNSEIEDLTFADSVRIRTTEVVITTLFFALGATIGSFVNVVVYRTPRGESLIGKPSACPQCETPISSLDNIPVIGWINLQGKCRSCQQPISARYPTVEAFAGGLFLLFYFVELLSGGRNLPAPWIPYTHTGVVFIIMYTKWDLLRLYLFHCLLSVTLLTWALIRYDRQRVPWTTYLSVFLPILVLVAIWPDLMVVPWMPEAGASWDPSIADALFAAAIGGCAGLIMGALASWLVGLRAVSSKSATEYEFVAGLALTGVMLGWQAVPSASVLTAILHVFAVLMRRTLPMSNLKRWPLTGSLFVAVVLQLLFWRQIASVV